MRHRAIKEYENALTCWLYEYISNQIRDATNTRDAGCVSATFATYLPEQRGVGITVVK
jgi:hypothetical protein